MNKQQLVEILEKIGDVYKALEQIPITAETSQVSLKLTEAGMWARMAADVTVSVDAKPTLEIKRRESRFFENKKS